MKAASTTAPQAPHESDASHAPAAPTAPPDDLAVLLDAAGRGDDVAWRRLIDLYARRICALARSRLGADRHELAEEITQSVFVTVATKLGHSEPGSGGTGGGYAELGKFESWLFRIAMNRIRDEIRRSRRQAKPTDPASFNTLQSLPQPVRDLDSDTPEQLRALRHAMSRLSEADREVVELRHHAGLSFKQIAELLCEPIGTLLARHHRALKKLKDLLTPDAENLGIEKTT